MRKHAKARREKTRDKREVKRKSEKETKAKRRPTLVSDFSVVEGRRRGDRRRPESRAALLSGWLTISTTYTSSTSYSASSSSLFLFFSFPFFISSFLFPIYFYSLLLRDRPFALPPIYNNAFLLSLSLSLSSYMHRLLFCLQGSAPSSTNQANMNYIHHLTAARMF